MLTERDIAFIESHGGDEPERLLLNRSKYRGVNVALCVKCIIARRKIKKKLPLWYENPGLVYPTLLCTEQCSSQATANYKAALIKELLKESAGPYKGADLTAGLGVDAFSLASLTDEFYCHESNGDLCRALEHNASLLGVKNLKVKECQTNIESINQLPSHLSFIYLDPSRRESNDSSARRYSIADCSPNLIEIAGELLKKSPLVVAKISPMADISQTLKLLPYSSRVDVVAVNNECRELLLVMERSKGQIDGYEPLICGVNLNESDGKVIGTPLKFTLSKEREAVATFASKLGRYLYEPGRELLKCGAFKLLSALYKIDKLALNTHLYTSERLAEGFPGKIFEVKEVLPYSKRAMKELAGQHKNINLSARNFNISTPGLKALYGINDGGTLHLFATTMNDGKKVLIISMLHQPDNS